MAAGFVADARGDVRADRLTARRRSITSAPMPSQSTEVTFDAGELAVVTRTEPSPFRMREVRRVAVTLSADDAEALAHALRGYALRARLTADAG